MSNPTAAGLPARGGWYQAGEGGLIRHLTGMQRLQQDHTAGLCLTAMWTPPGTYSKGCCPYRGKLGLWRGCRLLRWFTFLC